MAAKKQKQSRAEREDVVVIAHRILLEATGEVEKTLPPVPTKNPAAVALGRLGGLKGGAARAKKLSKKRKREIAEKAAKARWKKTVD